MSLPPVLDLQGLAALLCCSDDRVVELHRTEGLPLTKPGRAWVSIGATDLQTGLMALTRAVAQPTTF